MADANGAGAPDRDGRTAAGVWPDAFTLLIDRLRRSGGLILGLALIFAITGAALKAALPQKFTATAQLLIDPRAAQVFSNEMVNGQLDSNAAISFVESQMQVLASERVLARVIAEEKLAAEPGFRDAEAAPATGDQAADERLRDGALQTALARMLAIKRQERSYIVDVSATTADPKLAARIANAVVKAFVAEDAASRADAGRRLTGELTGRLSYLRETLGVSEQKAEAFRLKNGLVQAGDTLVVEQKLTSAVNDLSAAQGRTARAQARVDQLDKAKSDLGSLGALTATEDMRTVSFLIERLSAARENLAELNLNLGARHPALTGARGRVGEIEQRIGSELGRIRSAARADLARAKGEEADLSRQAGRLSTDVSNARQAQIELRALEQEVEANRTLLQSFETRSREADAFGRIATVNLRVISVAQPPSAKTSLTMTALWAIAGFVLGALVGLAWATLGALMAHGRPQPVARFATAPKPSLDIRPERDARPERDTRPALDPNAARSPEPALSARPASASKPALNPTPRPNAAVTRSTPAPQPTPAAASSPAGPTASPAPVANAAAKAVAKAPPAAEPPPAAPAPTATAPRPTPLREAPAPARPTPLMAAFERARRESMRGR